MIPFHHEHAEVNIIVRRSQEVHGLPKLCLVGGLNNGTHKKNIDELLQSNFAINLLSRWTF